MDRSDQFSGQEESIEVEMSLLLAMHMHVNAIECYHSEKSAFCCLEIPAGYYHKFTCHHAAMPSDTQPHLVLNTEVT